MEIILSQKPARKGSINISATLNTMEVDDKWTLSTDTVSNASLRAILSDVKSKTGKTFSMSNTAEMGKTMIVTRTA